MRASLDHLLWAVPDLKRGVADLARRCGVTAALGGRHPGVGTHNALAALGVDRYLEIIAPDPTQDRFSGFGLLLEGLRQPGLITWAAQTDDVEGVAEAARSLGWAPGEIRAMSRRRPEGGELRWRLMQIAGHDFGTCLPFFIEWGGAEHPSRDAPVGLDLAAFRIEHAAATELRRGLVALGFDADEVAVMPAAASALRATLRTPLGDLQLDSASSFDTQ